VRWKQRKQHTGEIRDCLSYLILSGCSKQEELEGRDKLYEMWRTEKHTGFWWVKIKERDHVENLGIDGTIILKTGRKVIGWKGMNLTDTAQNRDEWRAPAKVV